MPVSPASIFGLTPRVRIYRDGRELSADEMGGVIRVTVRDDMEGVDAFQIETSNRSAPGQPSTAGAVDLWRPGQRVVIALGYLDGGRSGEPATLIDGRVTATAPVFSTVDPAVLSVVGQGLVASLAGRPGTRTFLNMTDSAMAQAIAREAGLPIQVPGGASPTECKWDYTLQANISDLAFLRQRARRCGYVMTSIPDGDGRRLYFGPSPETPPVYTFTFGKDLHHFTPVLDVAGQAASVTVRGWNAADGTPVVATARRDATGFSGAMARLDSGLSGAFARQDEVVTAVTPGVEAAAALARGIVADTARRLLTAEGSCAGLPGLTVGARIETAGMGAWCDGLWVVSATGHQLGPDGYRTMFRCYRNPV